MQKLDQITGFIRAWGLILYASLPASLAMLNILDIRADAINFKTGYLAISILPLLILYILILARQKLWFLRQDHVHLRSGISILLILIVSTSICGLSLLIKNNYVVMINPIGWEGVAKSFFMAVSSLVVSSALFMLVLTRTDNLPGIPKKEFTDFQQKVKRKLIRIQQHPIWESGNNIEELLELLKEVEKDLKSYDFNIDVKIIEAEYSVLKSHILKMKDLLETIHRYNSPVKEEKIQKYCNSFKEKISCRPTNMLESDHSSLVAIHCIKLST